MGARYLTELADVLRAAGLQVWEVDGWRNRGRGSGGYDPGRPGHVMVHHTASPPSSDGWPDATYLAYGSPDAPLANLYVDRDGWWYVVAAGATNTNGTGTDPCGHVAADSMNVDAIGVEAGNDGLGEPWPDPQVNSYVAGVAALCQHYAIPVARVHGHAEWAPTRKIDPAGPPQYATGAATWDLDAFRADVATMLGPIPPPGDDDMPAYYCVRDVDGWPWVTDWATSAVMITEDQAARGRDLRGYIVAPDGGPWPIDAQDTDLMHRLAGG